MGLTLGSLGTQVILSWLALFLTARVFDLFFSQAKAGIKDDALAALTVIAITTVVGFAVVFLSLPGILMPIVYFVLIKYAYQLEGIVDIVVFYLIHCCIRFGLLVLGLGIPGLRE